MAGKPTPQARVKPTETTQSAAEHHPAIQLLRGMNGLHIVCSNGIVFHSIARDRRYAAEAKMKLLNLHASRQQAKYEAEAEEAIRRGEEPKGWSIERPITPVYPPFGSPSDVAEPQLAQYEEILASGETFCDLTLKALRAGGGQVLNQALTPGGVAKSVEIQVKVHDAEDLFQSLRIGLHNPSILIEGNAKRMDELGVWFRSAMRELGVVIGQLGLTPHEAESYRPMPSADAKAPTKEATTPPDEPMPGEIHFAILRYLIERRQSVMRAEIASDLTAYGRNAIHDAIGELHKWKCVHAPPRTKRPVAILDAGRTRYTDWKASQG